MWINKNEYDRLKDCEQMKFKLEQEVKRLADQVSAEVKDCKVGVWCKDCKHIGRDRSELKELTFLGTYVRETDGEVQYCKKHLHELCPEFEV